MQVLSVEKIGNWQKRTLAGGWLQYREGGKGQWKFQISGFHAFGNPNACHVLTSDGKREVRIDNRDRIEIEGRLYGRQHWDH